ncbi:tyrosine-protein kinase CSK-like isoform X3 [Apostichopus japonicus]|uniref:tyrosine-protein kinase CSK-like isoform X3 n=1 Tax=Stichopus japonicus TaxID=307972 RepID=UPI003AB35514
MDITEGIGFIHSKGPGCNHTHLPPESFKETNEYSSASDVWCIAVLMWHLFTFGQSTSLVVDVTGCFVPPKKPKEMTETAYKIMLDVWKVDATLRPSAFILREVLATLCSYSQVIKNKRKYILSVVKVNSRFINETLRSLDSQEPI